MAAAATTAVIAITDDRAFLDSIEKGSCDPKFIERFNVETGEVEHIKVMKVSNSKKRKRDKIDELEDSIKKLKSEFESEKEKIKEELNSEIKHWKCRFLSLEIRKRSELENKEEEITSHFTKILDEKTRKLDEKSRELNKMISHSASKSRELDEMKGHSLEKRRELDEMKDRFAMKSREFDEMKRRFNEKSSEFDKLVIDHKRDILQLNHKVKTELDKKEKDHDLLKGEFEKMKRISKTEVKTSIS